MADSSVAKSPTHRLWVVGLASLAVLAWPVACGAPAEPLAKAPTPPTSPSADVPVPASTTEATTTSTVEPAASPPAAASPPRPDPGPGGVACGAASCRAGAEICAPKTACGPGWPAMGCVAVAELRARSFGPGTACEDWCYGNADEKACDGAGDCGPNQACCLSVTIVPCGGNDAGAIGVQECVPAGSGRTPCHIAEMCSAADPTCRRKGASCVVDPATGVGTCEVPRPVPTCATPCPEGLSCVASKLGGRGECGLPVFECERGNQCAPDEACFSLSHECGLSTVAFPGTDRALCLDASDCVGYCGDPSRAFCRKEAGEEDGACECVPPCRHDGDCRGRIDCALLGVERFGAATVLTTPFCDQAVGRCDCQ